MSRVPNVPPWREAESSLVSKPEGNVISNAPSNDKPNTKNKVEMNAFTHTLELSCTTPNGPAIAVAAKPNRQNRTMMPPQKMPA